MMIPIVTHFRWLYSLFFGVLFFMLAVAPTFSHAQDCCPVGGSRLWIMDFQYVAERCDSSDNGQSQISVICTDHFLPLPTAAYIVAKDAQGSQRGYVWFEGLVAIGDYYQVNALTHTNLPENKRIIGPSLTLEVWSDIPPPLGSGILMQTITFHTSCSQPITAGDQYGAHV
ncbi:MAG: hypothetical protein OEQ53_19780, partial [Saprospiraceae bacterium]|nr:hypothetical protein [Saprospiraceae bacterium]